MSRFTVYPAIDLAGGRAVRLLQGRRERLRVVADDPVALASRFADAGAACLHVVDLDAAFGDGDNRALVGRMAAAVRCPLQVGGGVATRADAERVYELGVRRVVVGTAAIRSPELVERLVDDDPEGVVVAADGRGGEVAVSGWRESAGERVASLARRMRVAGVRHLLVTGVDRDGTGHGFDLALLGEAVGAFGAGVIASGGVGSTGHLAALAPLVERGLAGAVVGSLLVDGRATLAELEAVAAEW